MPAEAFGLLPVRRTLAEAFGFLVLAGITFIFPSMSVAVQQLFPSTLCLSNVEVRSSHDLVEASVLFSLYQVLCLYLLYSIVLYCLLVDACIASCAFNAGLLVHQSVPFFVLFSSMALKPTCKQQQLCLHH